MPPEPAMPVPLGDDAAFVRLDEPIGTTQARAAALRGTAPFEEVLATPGALTVRFRPERAASALKALAVGARGWTPPVPPDATLPPLDLPVRYDGADLAALRTRTGLSGDEFVAVHSGAVYTVDFLGFTPGFAYLSGLDPRLAGVGRLPSPRARVPAGSVGVAGGRSGVYALPGPGGWPIVGTCEATLFRPRAEEPFVPTPGRRVRFVPV